MHIFNTGLAATRMRSIYVAAPDFFGPIEVAAAAILEGPKEIDGYEIGANDGARWMIDLKRLLHEATDSEIADEYYRYRPFRRLPQAVWRDFSSLLMFASVVFLPRAVKGELLQVGVVFRNGVEARKPVITGGPLQLLWTAPLARDELKRRGLLRGRAAVSPPSGRR